jgi:hypothetical protein
VKTLRDVIEPQRAHLGNARDAEARHGGVELPFDARELAGAILGKQSAGAKRPVVLPCVIHSLDVI